jgi:hypothetical protein
LYYVLLLLVFLFPHYTWVTKIFLGAAAAYAATAAIDIFIIASSPADLPIAENVSIPLQTIDSPRIPFDTVLDASEVLIQPNALELDLDAILAIVVTAYLIGLPLQTWSKTVKSTRIIRYMVFLWNTILFAAAVCALVIWPSTNTGPEQFRFCYANFPDDNTTRNDGWEADLWVGTWNATVDEIFTHPGTIWQNLTYNCFYPCFNTSQPLRRPEALRATLLDASSRLAKRHDPQHYDNDAFGSIIYIFIGVFTAAQIVLVLAAVLKLASPPIPIQEPARLWHRKEIIWRHFKEAWSANGVLIVRSFQQSRFAAWTKSENKPPQQPNAICPKDFLILPQFILDVLVVVILVASLTLFPITVVGFVVWIEWYIWGDGTPSETPNQVGQWSVLVSVAVVLVAAAIYQFKDRVATEEELRCQIERTEAHLDKLKSYLEKKAQ